MCLARAQFSSPYYIVVSQSHGTVPLQFCWVCIQGALNHCTSSKMSSITSYFQWTTSRDDDESERALAAGRAVAEEIINASSDGSGRRRKRYTASYEEDVKTKIGKHALVYGNKSAVEKFSRELKHRFPEVTVRNFKRNLKEQMERGKEYDEIRVKSSGPRWRPLLLPVEIDDLTKKLVCSLRSAGSTISTDIVLASAKGIVAHQNVSLLKEHGGHIDLDKSWAKSFLTRLGYVKRKGTRTACKILPDFPEVKASFLNKVAEAVSTFHILPTMVVNCDQTGSKMVPVNPWSLAAEGSKQVAIVGLYDKREITVLLSVSLDGQLLPPQVIYAGKTSHCHSSVVVPPGWNITHSQNHRSTEETMIEFIEKVLSPHMATERQHLQLPGDTFGLCLWDVFAAH